MSDRTKRDRIKDIENRLIEMCRKVESRLETTVEALLTANSTLAEQIYTTDDVIDAMEKELESRCLKILLLEHPYAAEFKEVSSVLKMITDLERIGDQSSDICELILSLGGYDYIKDLQTIATMGEISVSMVKDSVNAYVLKDLKLAHDVIERDDKVDALFKAVKTGLVNLIKKDSSNADKAIIFMMIAKYIERIADHAVNICEWANYNVSGTRK